MSSTNGEGRERLRLEVLHEQVNQYRKEGNGNTECLGAETTLDGKGIRLHR